MTKHPQAIDPTGRKIRMESRTLAQGWVEVSVVERGRVVKVLPIQPNMILDSGLDNVNANTWASLMTYGVAGTGTTPTKDLLDGTWSQTGTTITSVGSTYALGVGDQGKWIAWGSGQSAKIVTVLTTTTATVAVSQSVASGAANLYRANQTGLATETKRSNSYPEFTATDGNNSQAMILDNANGKCTLRRTYDFTAEVGSVNYTEVGVSHSASSGNNLFARILLAGAVSVTAGQQLRLTYNLILAFQGIATHPVATLAITGWPAPYNIVSITSDGTSWTITTSAAHHYASGGKINIAGALTPSVGITAASSTVSDFTLTTASPHGRSPGDSITISGVTPSGYNGTWTCAAGTTGSTIVVTTPANPGTGTVFGVVRLATPGTWYDGGEYTMASGTTGTTIKITNATTITAAGAFGTVYSNTKAAYYAMYYSVDQIKTSGAGSVTADLWIRPTSFSSSRGIYDGPTSCSVLGFSSGYNAPAAFGSGPTGVTGAIHCDTYSVASYTNGNFYQDHTSVFNAGTLNYSNIRRFDICGANAGQGTVNNSGNRGQTAIILDEVQIKTSINKLTFVWRKSWGRVFA